MNFRTFYHLNELIDYADRIVSDFDTVSFDIFDTVFIRRIHNPDMVKPAVARYIGRLALRNGIKGWSWEKVQGLRDKIEKEHRAKTALSFADHEARYPDFMKEVLSEIFKEKMPNKILDQVTDFEMTLENAMIVPRASLTTWIRKLFSQKKAILLISDIYLPSSHLKRLVNHAGILNEVTDVISSADTFLAKASGKAFPLLKEKYNLNIERWMHIGDNPISDGLRPSQFGIRSFVLKDRIEKRRKSVAQMYTAFSNKRLFWKGRMLQHLMLPLEGENPLRDFLYIDGYSFLAPILGAFIQGILERTRVLGIKKIYFFSREGQTFLKFWEKAIPFMAPEEDLPMVHYLYVSRLALAGASCAHYGLPQSKADIAFLPPGNKDIRDMCRVFGLDIKSLTPMLRRYGLKEDDTLSPLYKDWSLKTRYKLVYLIEDPEFQSEIKRQTLSSNTALQRYLESEGFFDQPDVALVDVGWTGTIQRFLFEAVKHRPDKPRLHGFLFAAGRGIPYPATHNNSIEGIIYDKSRFDFASSTLLNYREFFEEAFRAPHPGLKGYQLTDNGFELLFRNEKEESEQSEAKQSAYFKPLQEGIIDGAARFGAASAILGYTSEELKPWIRYLLVSKLAFPKTAEVARIRHKHHLDDFYGKHKPPEKFFKRQKRLWNNSLSALRWNPWLRMKYYLFKERIE